VSEDYQTSLRGVKRCKRMSWGGNLATNQHVKWEREKCHKHIQSIERDTPAQKSGSDRLRRKREGRHSLFGGMHDRPNESKGKVTKGEDRDLSRMECWRLRCKKSETRTGIRLRDKCKSGFAGGKEKGEREFGENLRERDAQSM